jgi:hypothetical protein
MLIAYSSLHILPDLIPVIIFYDGCDDIIIIIIIIITIIIQFNSILYYLCAESTATRPDIDTAQCRYK